MTWFVVLRNQSIKLPVEITLKGLNFPILYDFYKYYKSTGWFRNFGNIGLNCVKPGFTQLWSSRFPLKTAQSFLFRWTWLLSLIIISQNCLESLDVKPKTTYYLSLTNNNDKKLPSLSLNLFCFRCEKALYGTTESDWCLQFFLMPFLLFCHPKH